ncbi:MAG: FGGY family carbohydrate kinase [Caldilineaceae bacterium]
MSPKYAIGIDFGTESGRALLVDVADGREIATAVLNYSNGVIDARLPESGVPLEPDWALQDPDDYIEVIKRTIPAVLEESGIDPADVIGLGIDFTACTMLPVKADGTPLCRLPAYRDKPHAWIKLWKHHAAQPEADRINAVAREMGEPWLDPLRRQDFVRVVLQQGAPDSGRSARGLRRGRPAHRSGGLGHLAVDRPGDATLAPRATRPSGRRRRAFPARISWARPSRPGRRGGHQAVAHHPAVGRQGGRTDAPGRRVDRPAARHRRGRGQRGRTRHRACGPGRGPRRHGHDHGHQHLSHGQRHRAQGSAGHVRRGGRRHPARSLRLRTGPERRGRYLRLVRQKRRAAPVSRGSQAQRRQSSCCVGRAWRAGNRAKAVCSRWTGGTATAPPWWTWSWSGLLIGATLATTAPEIYALIEATAPGTRDHRGADRQRRGRRSHCGGGWSAEKNRMLMQITRT